MRQVPLFLLAIVCFFSLAKPVFAFRLSALEAVAKLRPIYSQIDPINQLPTSYSGHTDAECVKADLQRVKYILSIIDYIGDMDDRINQEFDRYYSQTRLLMFYIGRVARDLSGPLRHETKFLLPNSPFSWETIENFSAIFNDSNPIVFPMNPQLQFSVMINLFSSGYDSKSMTELMKSMRTFANVFLFLKPISTDLIKDFVRVDLPQLRLLFKKIEFLLERGVLYSQFPSQVFPGEMQASVRLPIISTLTAYIKDFVSLYQLMNYTSSAANAILRVDLSHVDLQLGLVRRVGESCTGKNLSAYFKKLNPGLKDLCQVAIFLRDSIAHPGQKSNRVLKAKILENYKTFSEKFDSLFLPALHKEILITFLRSAPELALLPGANPASHTPEDIFRFTGFVRRQALDTGFKAEANQSKEEASDQKEGERGSELPEIVRELLEKLKTVQIVESEENIQFLARLFSRFGKEGSTSASCQASDAGADSSKISSEILPEITKDELQNAMALLNGYVLTIKKNSGNPKDVGILANRMSNLLRTGLKKNSKLSEKNAETEDQKIRRLVATYFWDFGDDSHISESKSVLEEGIVSSLIELGEILKAHPGSLEELATKYENDSKFKFSIENNFMTLVDQVSFLFDHHLAKFDVPNSYLYQNWISLKRVRNLIAHYNWIFDSSSNMPIFSNSKMTVLTGCGFQSMSLVDSHKFLVNQPYETRTRYVIGEILKLIENSARIEQELNKS